MWISDFDPRRRQAEKKISFTTPPVSQNPSVAIFYPTPPEKAEK